MKGAVKWFNDKKGFGYITCEETGEDHFVHYSDILDGEPGKKTLKEGQRVQFLSKKGEKGLFATEVKAM